MGNSFWLIERKRLIEVNEPEPFSYQSAVLDAHCQHGHSHGGHAKVFDDGNR